MPLKDGKLTPAERKIAEAYAVSGDVKYAGHAAGLSAISGSAHKALKRPEVQAEIARLQQERLFNDVLPQAVNVHMALLRNPKTPAGALVQAVKLAYDQTLGKEDAARQKEPHEMTPDELATAIAALQRVASDKARPIIEAEPIDADAAEDDIFA